MPEWLIPLLMLLLEIFGRLRGLRRAPPWQEPCQIALAIAFVVLVLTLLLPDQPAWVRRAIQIVVLAITVALAFGSGAFDLLGK